MHRFHAVALAHELRCQPIQQQGLGRFSALLAEVAAGGTRVPTAAGEQAFRTAVLRGSSDASAAAAPRLRVWQLYWVGGELTTSDARAKLWLAYNRLLGRGDDGAVVLIHTPLSQGDAVAKADALLGAFVSSHFGSLRAALDAARASR